MYVYVYLYVYVYAYVYVYVKVYVYVYWSEGVIVSIPLSRSRCYESLTYPNINQLGAPSITAVQNHVTSEKKSKPFGAVILQPSPSRKAVTLAPGSQMQTGRPGIVCVRDQGLGLCGI